LPTTLGTVFRVQNALLNIEISRKWDKIEIVVVVLLMIVCTIFRV